MPYVKKTSVSTAFLSRGRKKKCGQCKGCERTACGKCVPCKARTVFGSNDPVMNTCVQRVCTNNNEQAVPKQPLHKRSSASPLMGMDKKQRCPGSHNKDRMPEVKPSQVDTAKGCKPKVAKIHLQVKEQNVLKKNTSSPVKLKVNLNVPSSPETINIPLAFKTPSSPSKMSAAGKTPISPGKMVTGVKASPKKTPDDFPYVNTNRMTKTELSTLMMQLLKSLALKGTINLRDKPDWWPSHVQWGVTASMSAEQIIAVIRQCYRAYGKENMIISNPLKVYNHHIDIPSPKQATACRMVSLNASPEIVPASPVKSRGFPQDLYLPFTVEIFICYFCEKEFINKEKMRIHQKFCDERPPDLALGPNSTTTMVTNMDSSGNPPQISPKNPRLRLDMDRKIVPAKQYAGYLGLVPSQTASKLMAKRKCSEISSEILEEIEQPLSPVTSTPRTPKSLISQLSRDDAGGIAKKRLSYSLSTEKGEEKEVFHAEEEVSDSESEMEAGKPKSTNLLNIPITSLLGQKIQKYVHIDLVTPVLDNSDIFCKTPTKNNFLEKLRKKPPSYPITYKPRRLANLGKHIHQYKFNKVQVKEFLGKLKNGLNSNSQEKVKLLKKLQISLPRLSEKGILKWMPRQRMDRQLYKKFHKQPQVRQTLGPDEFPAGPTLLSKNIDKLLGLKKRSSMDNHSLSLSNYVSEEMEVEVSKLQLALYKALLYEMTILKPTVLLSNLHSVTDEPVTIESGKVLAGLESVHKHSPVKQQCSGGVGSPTSVIHDKSVLRTLLLKRKVRQDVAFGPENPAVDNSPKAVKHMSKKNISSKVPSLSTSCSTERQGNIRKVDSPCKVSVHHTTPSTSPQVTSDGGKSLCSPDVKSHCDDCVSVISLSSDGESFSSDCCMNCKGNASHKEDLLDRSPSHNKLQLFHHQPMLFQPLAINVEHNQGDVLLKKMLQTNTTSGSSQNISCDDSLAVYTPPSTPNKSIQTEDKVTVSDRQRRSTRQTSNLSGQIRHPPVKQESCVADKGNDIMSIVKQTQPKRVISLRHSQRSQSLTPTKGTRKSVLKTSVSLPSTPQKDNSVTGDVEKSSQCMGSGHTLRKCQSSLRSLQITPVKVNNPYALNSGNFIVSSSSPTKPSPQVSPLCKSKLRMSENTNNCPMTRGLKRLRSSNSENECSPRKSKRVKTE